MIKITFFQRMTCLPMAPFPCRVPGSEQIKGAVWLLCLPDLNLQDYGFQDTM
jgi:hypothetical protein